MSSSRTATSGEPAQTHPVRKKILQQYFTLKFIGKWYEKKSMRWLVGKMVLLMLVASKAAAVGQEDYRNFIYEGMRLKESCHGKKKTPSAYSPHWQKQRAKRSVYTTLQYLGLMATIQHLSLYARHFDFTEEEYGHLGKGLIGNYCSSNMTLMAHTTLKKHWAASFHHPVRPLPEHGGMDIFKHFTPLFIDKERIRKREFALTVDLFKAFCSWGNDPDDLRLLVPLVRNPSIMAFAFRHLTHTKLKWNQQTGELLYSDDPEASSISCQNFICRRDYYKRFVLQDLNRLYCRELRDVDYKKNAGTPPKIQKIVNNLTETRAQLMSSHFVSLITGVPDFFLYAEKFSDMEAFLRNSMEMRWKKWLLKSKHYIEPKFFYEERLRLDTIPSPPEAPLELAFQVNFGEWDRSVNRVGRVKKIIRLDVFKNVLANAKRMGRKNPERAVGYLKKMLRHQIVKTHPRAAPLPVSPEEWSDRVIAELSTKIYRYGGTWKLGGSGEKLPVSIQVHYAPFALQYLHRRP